MDIYVARQPIFDRYLNIYGYELLYRRSMNNFYEGIDDNQSTAELINNAFLTMHTDELTDGTRAFINFSLEMLIREIPKLLSSKSTVVEILERVKVNDSLIKSCRNLKKDGYILALDDFVFGESFLPLLEIAHIIKIEFSVLDYEIQSKLINKYKDRVKFLAEKVETREEYQLALKMGYDYFQGYFFSKPVIIKDKEISSLNANLIVLMNVLNDDEPAFDEITNIIRRDLGLSYKLLRLANSVFFGSRNKVKNIKQALVRLGIVELRKWIYILMLKDIQVIENRELIKICFVRAKSMELLSMVIGEEKRKYEYFLTGMFSSIDILLNKDMKDIVDGLLLSDDVKSALLEKDNYIKKVLDMVMNYELFKWDDLEVDKAFFNIDNKILTDIYIEALTWVKNLDYSF